MANPQEAPAQAPQQLVLRLAVGGEEDNKHQCNHPEHNVRYMPSYLLRIIESKEEWTWIDIRMIEKMTRGQDGSGQVWINGHPHGFDKETFPIVEREWLSYIHQHDGSWGYMQNPPAGVKIVTHYKWFDKATKQFRNPLQRNEMC